MKGKITFNEYSKLSSENSRPTATVQLELNVLLYSGGSFFFKFSFVSPLQLK